MTQPDLPALTDADIQHAVIDELTWTRSVDSARIGVAVEDGAVTLSGTVASYPQRVLAGRAALRVRGVRSVADEVQVHTRWLERTDADIGREAVEALERAVDVPPGAVKVVVSDRHITLSGQVDWQVQREACERAVRYVRGVFGVSDRICLTPTSRPVALEAAITKALLRNAQLDASRIEVSTNLDTVTLRGQVQAWAERRQAETAAWSAPGVTAVINEIQVRSA